jgi:DnaK suppressor protein
MIRKITKTFIKAYKERLEKDRQEIVQQMDDLIESDPFSDPDHASDNAAVDTDVREQMGHETIVAELKDLKLRLKDIDSALEKIKKNRYGYCEKCGKEISLARLKLIPEARFCVDDEKKLFT